MPTVTFIGYKREYDVALEMERLAKEAERTRLPRA